jgi:flagellar basal-body rod protein FlgG
MSSMYGASVSGLKVQQTRLDTIANNLANVSTTGYKSTRVDTFSLPPETFAVVRDGAGTDNPILIGTGVDISGTTHTFNMGGLQMTGRSTDLAILGDEGFFQVKLSDGSTGYTRDGGFSIDGQGQLVTSGGNPVEPPVQIPAGATFSQVAEDGQVMATPAGATTPRTVGRIELARFPNPQGLELLGGNLFAATTASGLAETGRPGADGLPQLGSGVLEGSNVDLAEQATSMIEAQRAYSMNLRSIQTIDEMIGQAIQLRS